MGYSYSIKLDTEDRKKIKIFRNLFADFFEKNNFGVGYSGNTTAYGPRNAIGIDYSTLFGENRIALEILFAKLKKFGQTYYDTELTNFIDYTVTPYPEYTKHEINNFPEAFVNLEQKIKVVCEFIESLDNVM